MHVYGLENPTVKLGVMRVHLLELSTSGAFPQLLVGE